MDKTDIASPNGYIIQLYKYALRYEYNNLQLLKHYNKRIVEAKGKSTKDEDYTALGDFDLLEINNVSSFRQYHDVSDFAKRWIGKRQCILLYDISDDSMPIRLVYKKQEERWESYWVSTDPRYENARSKKFFCLSMLSLTNKISRSYEDGFSLLKEIRRRILEVADRLNKDLPDVEICCEVFGTFNTSEIAVIWLTDEYVDMLHMLDYIKHMTVSFPKCETSIPIFMTTFSVVTMRSNLNPDEMTFNMKGEALVQLSFNDEDADFDTLLDIKKQILLYCDKDDNKEEFDAIGEYDWAVKCSSKSILRLICPKNHVDILHVGKRIRDAEGKSTGFFDENQKCRTIIRNNTRLLIGKDKNEELLGKLKELNDNKQFELIDNSNGVTYTAFHNDVLEENREFYFKTNGLREKLKQRIKPATGTVDTMDLLVTDYQSVISSTYSKIWAEDMHCQFSAVLHAINELVDETDKVDFWESYRDVTNAFKQQVHHLGQSNRLFFEIPNSHLRATGQYDFLMHAYYGITKKVIEAVYLMQEMDAQSELVPLMTINTEPQVKSELFFDFEIDTVRTMSLIIPNSVLTDPYRGIIYLCHEMFHYSVPQDRNNRNYQLGVFFLSRLLRPQLLSVIKGILKRGCPSTIAEKVDDYLSFVERKGGNEAAAELLCPIDGVADSFDNELKNCLQCKSNYQLFEKKCIKEDPQKDATDLKDSYLGYLQEYASSSDSDELFNSIFPIIFSGFSKRFEASKEETLEKQPELKEALEWVGSKFIYYSVQEELTRSDSNTQLLREARELRTGYLKHNIQADQDFPYIREARALAKAIDEAHSDIAAITLSGIPMTDYIVFFIRNLIELDRKEFLDISELDPGIVLRFSLVINYCGWKNINTYPHSIVTGNYDILQKENLEYFKNVFSWAFIPDKSRALESHDAKLFEEYDKYADKWVELIKAMLFRYTSLYCDYFEDVFVPILETADVGLRIRKLTKSKNTELAAFGIELAKIQHEFKDVINEYIDLYKTYPKIDKTNIDGYHKVLNEQFLVDLRTLHRFQNQSSLIELQKKNKDIISVYSGIYASKRRRIRYLSKSYKYDRNAHGGWRFDIHNWNELQEYLKYCKLSYDKKLSLWNMDSRIYSQIWYRGQTNIDENRYRLWPTLVRNIQDTIKDEKKHLKYIQESFVRYQRTQLDFFKTLVDGAPEIPFYGSFAKADYVALMQHYDLYSNLIDFSDNAFIALYLALKYYSEEDGDEEKVRDVAIYVFNPVIYNRFRFEKINEQIKLLDIPAEEKIKAREVYGIESEAGLYGFVPNISIEHNEKLYARYIIGNAQLDEKSHYQLNGENIKALPLAMWTPRINHRIRAQSGSFVAYDLYADINDESYTLERLQDEELKSNPVDPCIFLYKLTIKQSCCQDICSTLRTMGITRQFIYPEIEQNKHRF